MPVKDDFLHYEEDEQSESWYEGLHQDEQNEFQGAGVKYPHVRVKLVGENGNVFAIIGAISKGLKKAKEHEAANEFTKAAFNAGSYDEVLRLAMEYVTVY